MFPRALPQLLVLQPSFFIIYHLLVLGYAMEYQASHLHGPPIGTGHKIEAVLLTSQN